MRSMSMYDLTLYLIVLALLEALCLPPFLTETLVRKGIVWVLTRCEVRMDREAHLGETVSIETFPMPLRRWFFPRYFVFRDAAGAALGAASTLWVLFNLEKRCMVAPGDVAKAIPDNSDLTPPLGVPGPVPRLTGEAVRSVRAPVYSELDVNGHVNNARYADWLCDALGLEIIGPAPAPVVKVNGVYRYRLLVLRHGND